MPYIEGNNPLITGYIEGAGDVSATSCVPRTAGPFHNATIVHNGANTTTCYSVPLGAEGTITNFTFIELEYQVQTQPFSWVRRTIK